MSYSAVYMYTLDRSSLSLPCLGQTFSFPVVCMISCRYGPDHVHCACVRYCVRACMPTYHVCWWGKKNKNTKGSHEQNPLRTGAGLSVDSARRCRFNFNFNFNPDVRRRRNRGGGPGQDDEISLADAPGGDGRRGTPQRPPSARHTGVIIIISTWYRQTAASIEQENASEH